MNVQMMHLLIYVLEVHHLYIQQTKLNDHEHLTNGDNKRTRSNMSDTDTSGDEDQFMDDEVHEVIE